MHDPSGLVHCVMLSRDGRGKSASRVPADRLRYRLPVQGRVLC